MARYVALQHELQTEGGPVQYLVHVPTTHHAPDGAMRLPTSHPNPNPDPTSNPNADPNTKPAPVINRPLLGRLVRHALQQHSPRRKPRVGEAAPTAASDSSADLDALPTQTDHRGGLLLQTTSHDDAAASVRTLSPWEYLRGLEWALFLTMYRHAHSKIRSKILSTIFCCRRR